MSEPLTVAKDWDRLKQWAEEIELAERAHKDTARALAACEAEAAILQARQRVLEQLLIDKRDEVRSAHLLFHKVFAEMRGACRSEEDDELWLTQMSVRASGG